MHSLRFPRERSTSLKNTEQGIFLSWHVTCLARRRPPAPLYLVFSAPAPFPERQGWKASCQHSSAGEWEGSHFIFSCWPPAKPQKRCLQTPAKGFEKKWGWLSPMSCCCNDFPEISAFITGITALPRWMGHFSFLGLVANVEVQKPVCWLIYGTRAEGQVGKACRGAGTSEGHSSMAPAAGHRGPAAAPEALLGKERPAELGQTSF